MCPAFFENDHHQAVGHQQNQVLERDLGVIASFRAHQRSAANKKRFVDIAKILLDIAKQSSDAFPPLKSCLGGIKALIKHYEIHLFRIALNRDYLLQSFSL